MNSLEHYQDKALLFALDTLGKENAALIVAPTGAGKTALMAVTGDRLITQGVVQPNGLARPARVLVLTHMRNLMEQTRGEIQDWTGRDVGQFAARNEGGVDQAPEIVVGMVQSASAHLGQLVSYDYVFIDEAHHARDGEEVDTEVAGHYDAVLKELESRKARQGQELKVLGVTATPFRAGDKGLDPRLEKARRHVITYSEVIESGRIVPPRTITPDYKLKTGQRVSLFIAERRADPKYDFDRDIARDLRAARADSFHDQTVQAWLENANGKRTIWFVENNAEGEQLYAAYQRAGVPGVGVIKYTDNERAKTDTVQRYRDRRGVDVLINCRMVGEGFNVKDTDAVGSTSPRSSRSWLAQMAGRCMRQNDAGTKTEGIFIDMGAASHIHGRLEGQIEMQRTEVGLERARDDVTKLSIISSFWHRETPDARTMVLPARDRTWYAHLRENGTFEVFSKEAEVVRGTHKRSSGIQLVRKEFGDEGRRHASVEELAELTLSEIRSNFGWHSAHRSEIETDEQGRATAWERVASARLGEEKPRLDMFLAGKADATIDRPFLRRQVESRQDALKVWQRNVLRDVDRAVAGDQPAKQRFSERLDDLAANAGRSNDARRRLLFSAGVVLAGMVDQLEGREVIDERKRCQAAALVLLQEPARGARLDIMIHSASQVAREASNTLRARDGAISASLAAKVADACERATAEIVAAVEEKRSEFKGR